MEYFAGLDVSMAETHVCVMEQDGTVVLEVKVPSTPTDIAAALIAERHAARPARCLSAFGPSAEAKSPLRTNLA
jgi:hypothetical protein